MNQGCLTVAALEILETPASLPFCKLEFAVQMRHRQIGRRLEMLLKSYRQLETSFTSASPALRCIILKPLTCLNDFLVHDILMLYCPQHRSWIASWELHGFLLFRTVFRKKMLHLVQNKVFLVLVAKWIVALLDVNHGYLISCIWFELLTFRFKMVT